MQHVTVERLIRAPIDAVWDRYTDFVTWGRWSGMGKVRLEREGVPPPNGVGCVRVISNAGFAVHEEIVTFEPPRRMTYRVLRGGIPIRDHLGEVDFAPVAGGTRITWRCRFESRVPGLGPAFRWLVATLFRRALAGLEADLQR